MADKTSLLTKTGKTRLGPLTIAQLEALLNSTSKAKIKAVIRRRLEKLKSNQ
jgi:hypothetical protein